MSSVFDELKEKAIEKIKKKYEAALDSALADFMPMASEKINMLFVRAITDFYNDYSPIKYVRQYSMYQIMKITHDRKTITLSFSSSNMSHEHGGKVSEYVYGMSYKHGMHGMANAFSYPPSNTFLDNLREYWSDSNAGEELAGLIRKNMER